MVAWRSSTDLKAPRSRVYRAFLTAEELAAWLPPGEMTGVVHAFDARVGGGYEMSLLVKRAGRHLGTPPRADAAG